MFDYSFNDKTVEQISGRRVTRAVLEASSGSLGAVNEMIEGQLRKFDKSIQEIPSGELFKMAGTELPEESEGEEITDPPAESAAPTGTMRRSKGNGRGKKGKLARRNAARRPRAKSDTAEMPPSYDHDAPGEGEEAGRPVADRNEEAERGHEEDENTGGLAEA